MSLGPKAHFLSSFSVQSLHQAQGIRGEHGMFLPPSEEPGLWLDRQGLNPGSTLHCWAAGASLRPSLLDHDRRAVQCLQFVERIR